MALAAGNNVFLEVNGGFMSDAPLFGVIDYINGAAPDLVRITWEHHIQSTFSTVDQALNRLVVIGEDPAMDSVAGKYTTIFGLSAFICRSFFREPGGVNQRCALVTLFRENIKSFKDPFEQVQVLWGVVNL
jgi:hypothetical protein